MKKKNSIFKISVADIEPHPDNPRKNLGDLTELVESIKTHGVMQNLTVMVHPEVEGKYRALIGHRRLAAAKQAGLEEVPCTVVTEISHSEQVVIMLEENMQRNDLTVYEQAQGFQMMLDLGETAESISEKTGFSKATVYHRLNLAKLDQEHLKKVTEGNDYQLSLKELYELEKIKDVETRNNILKGVNSASNFQWKVKQAIEESERKERMDKVIAFLESKGISKGSNEMQKDIYSWNITNRVHNYSVYSELPKLDVEELECEELLFYVIYSDTGLFVVKEKKEMNVEETELDPEEAERRRLGEEKEKRRLELIRKLNELDNLKDSFIEALLDGDIDMPEDTFPYIERIWKMLLHKGEYLRLDDYADDKLSHIEDEDEFDIAAEKLIEETDMFSQILYITGTSFEGSDLRTYQGAYATDSDSIQTKKFIEMLIELGFSITEEQQQLLDGTHELYLKEE